MEVIEIWLLLKCQAKNHESSIIDKANSGATIYQFTDKTFEDVFHEYMEMEGINKYAPATTVYYKKTFEEYIDQEFKNIPIKSVYFSIVCYSFDYWTLYWSEDK